MFRLVVGLFQNFRGLLDMTHSRFFRIGFLGDKLEFFLACFVPGCYDHGLYTFRWIDCCPSVCFLWDFFDDDFMIFGTFWWTQGVFWKVFDRYGMNILMFLWSISDILFCLRYMQTSFWFELLSIVLGVGIFTKEQWICGFWIHSFFSVVWSSMQAWFVLIFLKTFLEGLFY